MKNFFKKLFGGSNQTGSTPAAPIVSGPSANELRQLLSEASKEKDRLDLERRLGEQCGVEGQMPAANDSIEIWIAAICSASDKTLAHEWLGRITGESDLERIASTARLADIRLSAAKGIRDLARIENLAKVMRNKDKGLHRHCQAILKQTAEKSSRAITIENLATQLREIIATTPFSASHLYEVRKQLTQLADGPDLAECHELLQKGNQLAQEQSARLRDLGRLVSQAQAQLEQLRDPAHPDTDHSVGLQELESRIAALPEELTLRREFFELTGLMEKIRDRIQTLKEDRQRTDACRKFLAGLAGRELTRHIEGAWNQLPKPDSVRLRDELQAEWRSKSNAMAKPASKPSAALPAPTPTQAEPAPQAESASASDLPDTPAAVEPVAAVHNESHDSGFHELLDALSTAIEAGELHKAQDLSREVDQKVDQTPPSQAVAGRYQSLLGQLIKLRDWSRWSAAQARDKLIEEAESLMADAPNLLLIADAVPRLRDEWKQLEAQGRPSAEQWQKFDQAASQAYQLVLDDRKEDMARRDIVRDGKSRLLDEAEAWLAGLDVNSIPPAELQNRKIALRTHWFEMAQANPRDERELQKRFRDLMGQLDARIEPFIQADVELRDELIGSARRLLTETNTHEAIVKARALNQRWRDEVGKIVVPRHLVGNKWKEFKDIINEVFVRRDAARKERDALNQEQVDARNTLLGDLEKVLDETPTAGLIESALASFNEQCQQVQLRLPVHLRDELIARGDALVERAESMLKNQRLERQQQIMGLMARKASLSDKLEAAVVAGGPEETIQHIQAEWTQESALPSELERKLAERFRNTATVTAEALGEGCQKRGQLLLDLEIHLDLPTPPEVAGERQKRQLEWLQSGLQRQQDYPVLLAMVADWYATAARPTADHDARIASIAGHLAGMGADN